MTGPVDKDELALQGEAIWRPADDDVGIARDELAALCGDPGPGSGAPRSAGYAAVTTPGIEDGNVPAANRRVMVSPVGYDLRPPGTVAVMQVGREAVSLETCVDGAAVDSAAGVNASRPVLRGHAGSVLPPLAGAGRCPSGRRAPEASSLRAAAAWAYARPALWLSADGPRSRARGAAGR